MRAAAAIEIMMLVMVMARVDELWTTSRQRVDDLGMILSRFWLLFEHIVKLFREKYRYYFDVTLKQFLAKEG